MALTVRRTQRGNPRNSQLDMAYWEGFEAGLRSMADAVKLAVEMRTKSGVEDAQRGIAAAEEEDRKRGITD